MRPVNKGDAPDVVFQKYQDAEPYLEERIGSYCSFCELPMPHVPEVEHKEAKSKGGAELAWDNLLLSCKYCNTRKGTTVKKGDKHNYLWPDESDTFHSYSYDKDIPELNAEYLEVQGEEVKAQAENLYRLVKLDNLPIRPSDKDRRYAKRSEARNNALESKAGWELVKNTEYKKVYLEQIKMLAKATGFFSTWMNVFNDEPEIKSALIECFEGTKEKFCQD